ncbi:hypothetical protein CLOSTMETH_00054 [[Clostridium] methylpentosum DSM 5476]|uniref:Uncharacterized protein n=1 Tax=[Clostridium] methylpentosum DSM 5476 TaxID=537013 RepID=C0E883_9FIRM|nr:hypothetical protein CLOSTMETH_00054 [[Clostridium] methylpentosum DSM 5476]
MSLISLFLHILYNFTTTIVENQLIIKFIGYIDILKVENW